MAVWQWNEVIQFTGSTAGRMELKDKSGLVSLAADLSPAAHEKPEQAYTVTRILEGIYTPAAKGELVRIED
jgi:hypothetical protein